MKRQLLTIILFIPILVIGQRKSFNREFEELKNPMLKSESYKAAKKLGIAGGLLGFGGGLIATAVALSPDADTESKKTAVKVTALTGGVFCLLGGAILGNVGQHLIRIEGRKSTVEIKFTGNAFVYNF